MMRALFKNAKIWTAALIILALTICTLLVGGTVAFFTDAKKSESVFTAGNVYIELTEASVKSDGSGNLIEDTSRERIKGSELTANGNAVIHNYGVVFPGQKIFKDPTVKNIGKNEAWVAAKVVIEDGGGDIHRLFKYSDGYDDIDIERLLAGGLLDEQVTVGDWNGISDVCYNSNYAMIQKSSHIDGKSEFYFIMLKPLQVGESVTVFDSMFINPLFGNAEMLEFRDLKITVQAFGVQSYGFSDCFSAMKGAFSEHFAGAR